MHLHSLVLWPAVKYPGRPRKENQLCCKVLGSGVCEHACVHMQGFASIYVQVVVY